jgi:hypothetical protein
MGLRVTPRTGLPTLNGPESVDPAAPELEALHAAISEAIDALVAWDNTAFESAVERQRAICQRLAASLPARSAGTPVSTDSAAAARKVRDLNRVYDRLLQHSIQWTHTIHSILEAGGYSLPNRASVHFRG